MQYVCCGTIVQVFASFQIFVIVFYCFKLSRLTFFVLVLLDSCVVSLFSLFRFISTVACAPKTATVPDGVGMVFV